MSNTSKQSTITKSDNISSFKDTRKTRFKERELNRNNEYQKVQPELSILQKLEREKIFNHINADILKFLTLK